MAVGTKCCTRNLSIPTWSIKEASILEGRENEQCDRSGK